MTFSGMIANKGNDTGSGTWTNSSGLSGSLSIETDLVLTPTSESLSMAGWNVASPTQLSFVQTLVDTRSYDPVDPNQNKFQGRQVYETLSNPNTGATTGLDDCYAEAQADFGSAPPIAQLFQSGSAWNVGAGATSPSNGNTYGYDSLGYTSSQILWYRSHTPSIPPCTSDLKQTMNIVVQVPGFSNTQ
jgi:hypothetical protein